MNKLGALNVGAEGSPLVVKVPLAGRVLRTQLRVLHGLTVDRDVIEGRQDLLVGVDDVRARERDVAGWALLTGPLHHADRTHPRVPLIRFLNPAALAGERALVAPSGLTPASLLHRLRRGPCDLPRSLPLPVQIQCPVKVLILRPQVIENSLEIVMPFKDALRPSARLQRAQCRIKRRGVGGVQLLHNLQGVTDRLVLGVQRAQRSLVTDRATDDQRSLVEIGRLAREVGEQVRVVRRPHERVVDVPRCVTLGEPVDDGESGVLLDALTSGLSEPGLLRLVDLECKLLPVHRGDGAL